jgi:hypothetical protein
LDPNAESGEIRKCRLDQLLPGMIIQEEIRTSDGVLLVAKGQGVTAPLIAKVKNFHTRRVITRDVTVSMPVTTIALGKGAS